MERKYVLYCTESEPLLIHPCTAFTSVLSGISKTRKSNKILNALWPHLSLSLCILNWIHSTIVVVASLLLTFQFFAALSLFPTNKIRKNKEVGKRLFFSSHFYLCKFKCSTELVHIVSQTQTTGSSSSPQLSSTFRYFFCCCCFYSLLFCHF